MLTLKRRRKRRIPPQRGRGAISAPFFCFAQFSIPTVGCQSVPSSGDWSQLRSWFRYHSRRGEATLSQQSRTSPLPGPHVPVGYG